MSPLQALFGPRPESQMGRFEYPPVEQLNPEYVALFGPPPAMRVGRGETLVDAQIRRNHYYQDHAFFGRLGSESDVPANIQQLFADYGLGYATSWVDVHGVGRVSFLELAVPHSTTLVKATRLTLQTIAYAQHATIAAGGFFPKLSPFATPHYSGLNEQNRSRFEKSAEESGE